MTTRYEAPTPPDGCELVDADGVPAFRRVTDDDYGWLNPDGRVMTLYPLPDPTDEFGGQRYIVRQSDPKETP